MSRGRGGFRGRGGYGAGGRGNKIGGQDVPWEYDPELKINKEPSQLFPPLQPPVADPPTEEERSQIACYRALRERIHEGPLYTVLGDQARMGKSGASGAAVFDPFEGMPTYTQKYKKQRRRIPKLDSRPYVIRFFPEELWDILGHESNAGDGLGAEGRAPKRRRLQISTSSRPNRLDEVAAGTGKGVEDQDEEELEKDPDEEGEGGEEEEPQDNDFEEDEDDMADDYNAENYFENGEDDLGDEGGDDYGGDDV